MTFGILNEDYRVIHPLGVMRKHQEIIDYLISVKQKYISAHQIVRSAYFCALATNYSKIGQYEEADKNFDAAFGACPWNYKVKLEMIDSYLQRGALKSAEDLLVRLADEERLEQSTLYKRYLLLSGRFFKLTGDYSSALHCFRDAQSREAEPSRVSADIALMESFLESPSTRFNRMSGCMEHGHHLFCIDRKGQQTGKLCLIFMKNVLHELTRTDDKIQALAALTQYSMDMGDLQKAEIYNQQVIDIDGNHARSLAARIRIHLQGDRLETALSFYHQDKSIIIDDPRAAVALARSFSMAGRTNIAGYLLNVLDGQNHIPLDVRQSIKIIRGSMAKYSEDRYPA